MKEYEGTEADAMEEWEWDDDCESEEESFGRVYVNPSRKEHLLKLYSVAKSAKVGSVIKCPTCGKDHKKTTYHKVFCSNGKKTKQDCKSKYHNTIHPERLERVF